MELHTYRRPGQWPVHRSATIYRQIAALRECDRVRNAGIDLPTTSRPDMA